MKRYLVFGYASYYPGGGWTDFIKSFDNREDAIQHADDIRHSYNGGVEVVDLEKEEDIYIYPHHREAAT